MKDLDSNERNQDAPPVLRHEPLTTRKCTDKDGAEEYYNKDIKEVADKFSKTWPNEPHKITNAA